MRIIAFVGSPVEDNEKDVSVRHAARWQTIILLELAILVDVAHLGTN